MTAPGFLRRPDGSVLLAGLAPAFVHVLHELPSLLETEEDEAIHERLFPYPSDDPDERKEWERLVHPDLFALVRSAREIVAKARITLRVAAAAVGTSLSEHSAMNCGFPAGSCPSTGSTSAPPRR